MNEKQKTVLEDAQKTGNFLVALMHAACIPLRTVSRVPGSMGAGAMFPGILWGHAFMAISSCILFPTSPTRYFGYFFQVTGWLWLLHIVYYLLSYRDGRGTYSHSTGKGWLNKFYPHAKDPNLLAFLSDLICGGIIAAIFINFNDTGSAGVILVSVVCSFLSTALLGIRDKARQRRIHSALEQQRHWQELMRDSLQMEDME